MEFNADMSQWRQILEWYCKCKRFLFCFFHAAYLSPLCFARQGTLPGQLWEN